MPYAPTTWTDNVTQTLATYLNNIENGVAAATRADVLTNKGDLYVATAAGVITRLGVGTDGQVLTVDGTTATGTKWATVSGGGATTISAAQGTWLNGATDKDGATVSSDRFNATWRNGICIMHIDFKRGTSTDIIGQLAASTPPPPSLTEIQMEQGASVWITANDRNVHAQGVATNRYNTNLTWLY